MAGSGSRGAAGVTGRPVGKEVTFPMTVSIGFIRRPPRPDAPEHVDGRVGLRPTGAAGGVQAGALAHLAEDPPQRVAQDPAGGGIALGVAQHVQGHGVVAAEVLHPAPEQFAHALRRHARLQRGEDPPPLRP